MKDTGGSRPSEWFVNSRSLIEMATLKLTVAQYDDERLLQEIADTLSALPESTNIIREALLVAPLIAEWGQRGNRLNVIGRVPSRKSKKSE